MNDFTKKLFETVKKGSDSIEYQFPPPAVADLDPTLLEYNPNKSIKWSFPIKERYNNPFGITFGGYFAVFFDAVFGPFSGLTAGKPTTSLDLNVTFIKALRPADKNVIVESTIVSKSKTYLNLYGKAFTEDGTLVATCTTRMLILNR